MNKAYILLINRRTILKVPPVGAAGRVETIAPFPLNSIIRANQQSRIKALMTASTFDENKGNCNILMVSKKSSESDFKAISIGCHRDVTRQILLNKKRNKQKGLVFFFKALGMEWTAGKDKWENESVRGMIHKRSRRTGSPVSAYYVSGPGRRNWDKAKGEKEPTSGRWKEVNFC